ncbi:MAG TPA: DEAD/DEAH box helicase, partial [Vicinamibacterales bacterium]|nr:DEAD/DEAH box helicase [Vicinamibacterales bacterium]
MNSNTTDRHRSRRGSPHRGPARGRRPSAHGHSHAPRVHKPSTAPELEPTPCDATPVPFASLNLDTRLQEGIRDLGFVNTRPIQSAVIPLALAANDLIACAETGTGKTAAFVVPTLQWLLTGARVGRGTAAVDALSDKPPKSRVLVLAPTRELAVQI